MDQLISKVDECLARLGRLEALLTQPNRKDRLHAVLLGEIFREDLGDKCQIVIGVTEHATEEVQGADVTINNEVMDKELIDAATSLAEMFDMPFRHQGQCLYFAIH